MHHSHPGGGGAQEPNVRHVQQLPSLVGDAPTREQASLHVSFDPNYHGPEGVGLQQKAIRITAGDISQPLAEIRLTATVEDEPGTEGVPSSPSQGSHQHQGQH